MTAADLVAAFGEQTFEFSKTFDLAGRARGGPPDNARNRPNERAELEGEANRKAEVNGESSLTDIARKYRRGRPFSSATIRHFPGWPQFLQYELAQFQRDFDGSRAGRPRKKCAAAAPERFSRARCELLAGSCENPAKRTCSRRAACPANGGGNGRMRMAVQIHPPGRYGVENLAAVPESKKHAFAHANPKRRRIGTFLREKGATDAGRVRS